MRYLECMRAKKEKVEQKLINDEIHSKAKYPDLSTSFVRRSGMVRKLLTMKPTTAIPILKHVWDQLYKIPEMWVLMNQYWCRDTHLVHLMLHIRKHKGWKNDLKLLQSFNKVKQKYNNLWQACRLAHIS